MVHCSTKKKTTTTMNRYILATTILLLLHNAVHATQPNLQTPSDVDITVNDLEVPYGRSVYLDPHQHLSIDVREGDYCSVMVLPSPFNDILGSLSEKSFPCDFRPGEIKYSHFGARSPSRDYINLQVRYDTSTKTYIRPLRLTVQVLFIQRSVITNSYFLTVKEMLGYSEPINEQQLGFTYDREMEVCRIATLSGTAGLPRYGHLVDDPSKSAMVGCDEFLDAGVRYKHTAESNSPDRDEIPMVVELLDQSGNLINQEYFQIMVKIVNGVENTPPTMNFSSTYLMEINQFVMTAFTAEMLRASDVESFDGDLIFNVTKPLSSEAGKIVSTDDRDAAITSFRQQDVWDLKIAYKPPAEDSDVPRTISIEFQIVDTEGSVSDPFNFMVVVNPMNTMAPVVTTNTGLLLYQGQSRTISSDRTLEISDENNLSDVQVQVLHGPRHGYLTINRGGVGGSGKVFTPADLADGTVVYQHDGTETYSDNIVFRMTDGDNVVEFLFPIYIASIDTNPPHVDANTILEVNEGDTVQVSNWVLNAVDTYYGSQDIIYTLMREYSNDGEFILIKFEPVEEEEHQWSLRSDGFYEKTVHQWTQANIDEEELFYRHFGPHSTEVVMDVHGFYVQDGADPPNKSPMNQFVVKVSPIDMQPPTRYPGVPLQMKVREFELTPFNRDIFRYTDQDSNDKNLVFKLESPITELTTGSHPLSDTGKIVLYERPEEEVTSFTQAQVDHLKIAYQPPNTELGMIARMLQFTFSVTDEDGNELPEQTFVIFLSPVDNKPPLVVNKGFVVRENGLGVVTQVVLDATDEDTDDQAISFTLVSEPKHGYLQYNAAQISLAGAFTRGDIQAGRILYQHLGSEANSDSFGLVVSDGMHKIPILVHITVQPIDDEQPLLAEPIDGTLGLAVELYERGVVTITSEVLRATDTDTNDLMLTFIVTKKPARGQILVNNEEADKFTQKDITSGNVMYAHTAGEIGTDQSHDSFELTLSDMSDEWTYGGNRVERIELSVTILPVDSEPPIVSMTEQLSVFEGARTTIRRENLDASDKDTFDDDILCVITTQASEGFVENSSPAPGSEQSRAGQPISSFRIADIRAGDINYVQSVHQGSEPTEDRFAFVCQDGVPNLSVQNHFTVNIKPVNDEIPRISNIQFVVEEGGDLMLDLTKLNGDDDDVPKDQLFFTVTMHPRHGSFFKETEDRGSVEVTSFTYGDLLEANIIYYKHDGSETTEDDFEVELSDGSHSVRKVITILITPVDDETPRLNINNGLEVEINETKIITNDVLKATDLDSDDGSLEYVIKFGPQQGQLILLVDDEEQILQVGDSFTQEDIDEDRLSYMHTAQVGIRDLIKFDVTDGVNPLIDRYFYVSVAQMDVLYPRVVNKGVTLKEGGRVTLTTDILSTADMNSNDEQLTFLIGRAPSHGHLESTDHPGLPISIFTQLELAGNKIQYVHTGADEIRMDSFQFEVTDGFNPVYRTFRISISDVDNKKPVVTIGVIRVKEGTNKIVTPFELKVDDRDTDDELLVIRITQIPLHGKLMLDGKKPTRSFTMVDLNDNRVSYTHDGSETTEDTFSFVVSDGTHDDFYVFPNTSFVTREPQKMKIEIVSVDNKVPQLLRNRGAPTLTQLIDGRRGFKFTRNVLRAEDSDSDSSTLTFILTSYPNHGKVVNFALDDGLEPVSSFTQGDVDNMFLYYILDDRSNSTGDEFSFTVRDSGGNELAGNVFRLNWGCISLESANYRVEEDKKYLHINLLRRGYLGETSFVTITTRDGTATSGADFRGKSASQVQFNPGQSKANWKVKILQDEVYERSETFYITLSEPVMGILEEPRTSIVTITDQEDESTVFIEKKRYELEENEGKFMLPIKRSGDLSQELMVICYTESDTAAGTATTSLGSFKDFISRPEDHNSLIRFSPGESEKFCPVVVIDDSLYETEEKFFVKLTSPMNGRLGNFSSTDIVILPDPADEPIFYFDQPKYEVDESVGQLEVRVWRTGTDLTQTASVTVQSRKSDPESAVANDDYVGISDTLEFAPGVKERTLHVSILDDLGNPLLEGPEKFELFMSMPLNAILGMPDVVQVTINDSYSDLPLFQFGGESAIEVKEEDGWVVVNVTRNGDLSQPATVRCYTRQSTAKVMMDFQERPDTDDSIINFPAGSSEAKCRAELVDDTFFEENEQFRLVLGSPLTNRGVKARLGANKEVLVTINDNNDRPIIGFTKTIYDVTEPKDEVSAPAIVSVAVARRGDASHQSVVRVFTKDGNAESGKDYNALSKELIFDEGVMEQIVDIEVLFDEEREIRESFTVRLEQDQNLVAELDNDRAIIYINQVKILADVTFPSIPSVISLRDYDDMSRAPKQPSPGYPVICVSPCNPKHTNYDRVSSICESEGLNDTQTQFRWLVAAPSGTDGVTNPLHEVAQNTFFTNTNMITLDSIYFKQGSRIACVARAVNNDGEAGLESTSTPVTVSTDEAVCQSRIPGSVGVEPFSAHIRHTGSDDGGLHRNLVKITVSMPHVDGMLPVISTRQLSNFEITLSRDGTRVGNHRCSNIINFDEMHTKFGFLTNETRDPNTIGETYRYQYDESLRGKRTLQFYRNLKHEACMWEFTAYYDMTELVQECGGQIGTDGQVLDLVQSYVSLRVPLYVSYVYHSPVGKGWQHFDQETELRLTFVYDTAILWDQGIGTPPEAELQGYLYPTSMRIRADGRLVVNFRTEARFRGLFVAEHPGTSAKAMVMSSSHSELTMTLSLVRSADTYNNPEQKWTFVSDYAIRDYSGTYTIKLIPCTTPAQVKFSPDLVCNPRDPLSFDMDIRFQQVSDPVSAEFSLNTNFYLLSKKSLYLSDGSMGFAEDSDPAFVEGAEIYGRVAVDPVQNLGNSFDVSIEKVFICSGRDGYVPKYDPESGEFGCLADSPILRHRYKVLDKEQPDTQDFAAGSIPFKAQLAIDDPEAFELRKQSGTDGFRMVSNPLFTVNVGREWYLHAIYTVHAKDKRIRRSIITAHHHNAQTRWRRSSNEEPTPEIGEEENRGTQMMHVNLDRTSSKGLKYGNTGANQRSDSNGVDTGPNAAGSPIWVAILLAVVSVVIVGVVAAFLVYRKRKRHDDRRPDIAYSAATRTTTTSTPKHVVVGSRGQQGGARMARDGSCNVYTSLDVGGSEV